VRARRWPLHPPPSPGEALSSWLQRIADLYGLSLEALLRHNLGAISYELDQGSAELLDLDPGESVLLAISERTGVAPVELRLMTIAGWVPWLLDTLETSDSTAFETYVRQDSVLLAPTNAPRRQVVSRWRPWLPAEAMTRDCPACRSDPAGGPRSVSHRSISSSPYIRRAQAICDIDLFPGLFTSPTQQIEDDRCYNGQLRKGPPVSPSGVPLNDETH
jgi:hypothetical protein